MFVFSHSLTICPYFYKKAFNSVKCVESVKSLNACTRNCVEALMQEVLVSINLLRSFLLVLFCTFMIKLVLFCTIEVKLVGYSNYLN